MACHFARWAPASAVLDTQRLSDEVIAATRTFSVKRRTRFLQGRILLAEMMFYLYGLPTLPPIATTPTGRPCFADHQLPDFSLAYASNTVGVLLSDEGKVGLDIEVMRARGTRQSALQHAHQTPAESAWIGAQDDRLEAETQLWSIRQSVLKISGLGNSGQATLRLHPFSGHLRSSATPDVQVMSDADEYLSWACAGSPGLDRLLCWRYEERGGLRKDGEISPRSPAASSRFVKLTGLKTPG
ncbi:MULTISPECIES: 4'-phosphopantetheinyl transferase superfamily protein [Serratia]|uniref:4'-phosphopantetheinyl transferase family protein n=1 Tax=Serratia TaxID=613 RepID=UPI0018D8F4B0|nr:4'-phosphopantetheinyl transferase superfamily protein [Serratia marcescens]MBH2807994.1 4'-phosphopantetheinyl transferase superfamily protein [Serratia marcescens]MBH2961724.1 4'-phosphopantetheinyl transferase superfamily protein [Serratia marcescens]MBN5235571.1 4'-phosphopantetheinyl transferase superfamily protein [Serratia marcescens]